MEGRLIPGCPVASENVTVVAWFGNTRTCGMDAPADSDTVWLEIRGIGVNGEVLAAALISSIALRADRT